MTTNFNQVSRDDYPDVNHDFNNNTNESIRLLTLLNETKAPKATTLAGYGITDAYTKLEVDGIIYLIQADINTLSAALTALGFRSDTIELIAKGASRAFVFQTLKELDAWLLISDNISKLRIGDNFLIVQRDVPDFWWDGTQKQELETAKIDLSNIYTMDQVDALLSNKLGRTETATSAKKLSPGANINGKTIVGDGSAEYAPLRHISFGAHVPSTDLWYKFAETTLTGNYEVASIMFHIHSAHAASINADGILRVQIRSNPAPQALSVACYWEFINGMDINDFVFTYDSNIIPITCAVWGRVKQNGNNIWYFLDEISETGTSSGVGIGATVSNRIGERWNLFNRLTGVVSIPLGLNKLNSKVGSFMGEFNPAISYTVELRDLQNFINNMSKFVNRSITIKVLPGEISTAITLNRFDGRGVLNLFAVDENGVTISAPGVETHKIASLVIGANVCQRINVQGFTCMTETVASFQIYENSNLVHLLYCNATEGQNTTASNSGLNTWDNPGIIRLEYCTISNKAQALTVARAHATVIVAKGTGNATIYYVSHGGRITVELDGTISGAARFSRVMGGLFVDVGGIPESQIIKGV